MRIKRQNLWVVVLPLGAFVSLAPGCSEATSGNSLAMEASFAPGVPRAARDESIRVEAYLVDSCDSIAMPERPSDAIDSTYTLRDGGEGRSIELPEPGEYGLYALSQDSNCAAVAAGCTPVTIGADHQETVTVVMGAFSGESCSADEQCSVDTGECIPFGGGTGGVGGDGGGNGAGGTGGAGAIGGSGGSGSPSCTVANEDQVCDGTRCNPVTLQCSSFGSAERGPCETCDSDDNCWSSLRCVPMYFGGDDQRFPNENVGFCLHPAAFDGPGGCNGEEPYVAVLSDRESLSGEAAAAYCGVHEDLTTCYAVEAQLDERLCTQGRDDECPEGGICRYTEDNGKWDYRCTYFCTSNSECRNAQGWTLTCDEFCGA